MTASLTFNVFGIPAPQGSKNRGKHGSMYEANKGLAPWRAAVEAAGVLARQRLKHPGWRETPVAADVVFYMPRPKAHYRTGRYTYLLRPDVPHYCYAKPDVDKLLRSTFDALTRARVFDDDARVVIAYGIKLYADDRDPGAVITLASAPP